MSGNAHTPKARALGNALREARTERDLSLRALAARLDRDPGVLSRWETGDRTPKPTDVAQVLTMLGVTGDRYDEIIDLTRGTRDSRWLAVSLPEQRQQMAAFLEYERTSAVITEVSPLLIPGLLQTSEYTRAIMSAGGVPNVEIESRVAVRIGRREVLVRRNPVNFYALIGEAALHQAVGGTAVLVEQLQHLVEMTQQSNVSIRVIPFDSGWHPALEGPFILFEPAESAHVVQLENRRSGLFLHEYADVDIYRRALDTLNRVTLSREASRRCIAEARNRMESAT